MLADIQFLSTLGHDCIEEEDFREAAAVFTTVLSKLSSCMLTPTLIGGAVGPSHYVSMIEVYSASPIHPRNEIVLHPYLFQSERSIENKQDIMLCDDNDDRLLQSPQELSTEEYNIFTIITLFNLGLCYHLKWNTRGRSPDRLLLQALLHYEQAYALACEHHSQYVTPEDPVLEVIMAICTNATHINSEMARFIQINAWNMRLLKILQFTKITFPSMISSCTLKNQQQEQRESNNNNRAFFNMNACINHIPRDTAPAA